MFFLIKGAVINNKIVQIANEKGEKYGVTDFESDSTDFFGIVKEINLDSETYASLSDEDRFQIMHSLCSDEELTSLLVDYVQDNLNPLLENLSIYSGDKYHCLYLRPDGNSLKLIGGKKDYFVEDATSYGYTLPFENDYGTEDTICIANDCENTIVRTGNSNACRMHAGICRGCHTYINKGDERCDRCAKEAYDAVYEDVSRVLGDGWE